MTINRDYPCNADNYKRGRDGPVRYLVIHYVGALGGAKANARYYGRTPGIEASAHYFVGHASEGCPIYQSVPEGDTAWHCGAKKYKHPECRNANSIGVELCCHQDGAGRWYFDPETVDAAVPLCRDIMARYGIPIDRVVRHYDVTGKNCPAPFVEDVAAWAAFKGRLVEPEEKGDIELAKEEMVGIVNEVLDAREREANAKPVADWASEAWAKVTVAGIMDGNRPWAPVTRQELAVIISRLTKI